MSWTVHELIFSQIHVTCVTTSASDLGKFVSKVNAIISDPEEPSFWYGTQLTTTYPRLILHTLRIYKTKMAYSKQICFIFWQNFIFATMYIHYFKQRIWSSQDSADDTITRWWAELFRVQIPAGKETFSLFQQHSDWPWGPPRLLLNGFQGCFPQG
jgi:hypothetical protein